MIPLDCQLRALRKHREAARTTLIAMLENPTGWAAICRVQEDRLVAGFSTYGDEMWRYRPERLAAESIEEVADFLNYEAVRLWQRGQ